MDEIKHERLKSSTIQNANIRTIYASHFISNTLWAFVCGQRLCGKDINEAIRCFMVFMGLEDLEFTSLKQAYYRKNYEYVKSAREISEDAKEVFDQAWPDEIDRVLGKIKKTIKDQ